MNGARTSHRARPAALVTAIGAVALLMGGCASPLSPSAADAASVAEDFAAAVAAGDTRAACELLVPAAREDAATATGDCESGLRALPLPEPGAVVSEEAHGRAAFIELEHDTVFLAISGSEWRVRAAGCVEQGDAPFDCLLEGD